MFVYTDESYIHQNHQSTRTYLSKEQKKDGVDKKKKSKGRRLVILHAITSFGPLCSREETGYPVSDLTWSGDTPHPSSNELTCETLWVANSHKGDYHDNMTSDIFVKWVNERLFPTFEKLYPSKKMILVCDNAPYHHKREIGSLANLSKGKTLELMQEYEVETIDLPITTEERKELANCGLDGVENLGECVRIKFDADEQKQTSRRQIPSIANLDELKLAFVTWLKDNKPEALNCKVENLFKEKGYEILWTPPYAPDLQPIEMFWAAGKNHAAQYYKDDQKMKETVRLLREGWYGNGETYLDGHPLKKGEIDCSKLINHSVELASTKFVPVCRGIKGTIGELIIDENYIAEPCDVPIDTLVLTINRESEEDNENEVEVELDGDE